MADLLTPFELDFDPGRTCDHQFKARFFYYTEFSFSRHAFKRLTYRKGNAPRLDSLLGKKYIEGNTYRITQRYLTPRLIKTSSPWSHLCVDEQLIIIHLRAGDIASLDHHAYLTNPLCYYKFLSNRYRRCLVVSEPGAVHPLRDEILELFDWSESISGTVHEDFSILLDAKRLASSGVGTFSVAAALLSQCLQVFYCSNIYQDEHLNPKMLPPNRVQMLQLPGFVEAWRNSNDRHSLLRSFGTGSQ